MNDVFYLTDPLPAHISPVHAGIALSVIAMSAVALIALPTHPRGRLGGVTSWPTLALVTIYQHNSYVL